MCRIGRPWFYSYIGDRFCRIGRKPVGIDALPIVGAEVRLRISPNKSQDDTWTVWILGTSAGVPADDKVVLLTSMGVWNPSLRGLLIESNVDSQGESIH